MNHRKTRKRCEICSTLTIKTPDGHDVFWCFYSLLWTYFTPFSSVSIVHFEQVITMSTKSDNDAIINKYDKERGITEISDKGTQ